MTIYKSRYRNLGYFLAGYLVLWLVLFEFILPVNNILPKPSTVFETFPDLWTDYELPINYLSTITSVYISMILAYFAVMALNNVLLNNRKIIPQFILSLEWFSEYIPGVVIGLVLIYWFPASEYIEFIFAFMAAFLSLVIRYTNESGKVREEYINAARSLGAGDRFINKKIKWKAVQPALFGHILELHLYIWTILLAFEFFKGGYGVGSIFRTALEYNDLSAIFSNFMITGITIFAGSELIRLLSRKYAGWGRNV